MKDSLIPGPWLAVAPAVCAILLVRPASAAPDGGTAEAARLGLVPPETIAAHLDELDITPEQHERLRAIVDGAGAEVAQIMPGVEAKRAALMETLADDDVTPDAAEAALRALLAAEAEATSVHFRALVRVRAELSPEQRERALELTLNQAGAPAPASTVTLEQLEAQAKRIQAAFEELGTQPAESLGRKGKAFELLLESGDLDAAHHLLARISAETGIDAPQPETPDFTTYDPGDTTPDSLRARLDATEDRARTVTSLPLLRQLAAAAEALENAKSTQDPDQAGRILTWAEGVIGGR